MSHAGTARLFIALELPDAVAEQLGAWARLATRQAREHGIEPPGEHRGGHGDEHRGGHGGGGRERSRRRTPDRHGMRLLEPEQMHLTMHFLGSRPAQEIEPLAAILQGMEPPALGEVSLGAPLWLPRRGPRVLAVELHDEGGFLSRLHGELAGAIALQGLTTRPAQAGLGRPLHPHITVARMRRGSAPRERALAPTPQLSFLPRRLTLFRSLLAPEGASYEAIASRETVAAPGRG